MQRRHDSNHRLTHPVWLIVCLFSAFIWLRIPAAIAETVTLAQPQQFPIVMNGKPVGKTTAPAGTQVDVVRKDGDRYLLKFPNAEPAWVTADKLKLPAPATEPEPSTGSAAQAPSPPAAVDIPTKLKDLTSLIQRKKWRDLADACQALANSSEEALKPFAALGADLSSALKDADLARQKKPKTSAEATRLRRNAEVIDRPNPLHPEDHSNEERARKLREQADSLEENDKNEAEQAERRIAEIASTIESQIATAGDSGTPDEETAEAGDDNPSDDSEASAGSFIPTLSLEFKGFSLNMSYDQMRANVEERFGAMGQITSEDGVDKDARLIGNIRKARYTTFFVGGESACKAVWQPGTDRKYIARLLFFPPFAAKLFDAEGLVFGKFIRLFIDNYDVPEIATRKVTRDYSTYNTAEHISDAGWRIFIHEEGGGYTIVLERAKALSSTTFGR